MRSVIDIRPSCSISHSGLSAAFHCDGHERQLRAENDAAPVNAERPLSRVRSNKVPVRLRPQFGHLAARSFGRLLALGLLFTIDRCGPTQPPLALTPYPAACSVNHPGALVPGMFLDALPDMRSRSICWVSPETDYLQRLNGPRRCYQHRTRA